jgi:phthiocerol/phenolphthiocerol synthesis type-I polyketide synthase D
VFVGASTNDYGRERLANPADISGWTGTGVAASILANRISYVLDLRGPSLTVDTACSSSLVALHLAKRSLDARECDLAIVAGVNLILSPAVTVNFDRSGAMAPGGRCRPFDADADGYVRSEGCLAVVLTRPEDADGRHVTVVASAVNQDGRSNGLMAPNPLAQQDLLAEVYSGIAHQAVCYVEAHGTGTPLGDPIEATALGTVLGKDRARPLLIGSIKSNLGHLEAAAGLAGLVKAVLALEHGRIPPTMHYRRPNPRIDFDRLRLAVADRSTPLPPDGNALIGVSSFGFGGTNAHAVLRQPRT